MRKTFKDYIEDFTPETQEKIQHEIKNNPTIQDINESPDDAISVVKNVFGSDEPDALIALQMMFQIDASDNIPYWGEVVKNPSNHLKQ